MDKRQSVLSFSEFGLSQLNFKFNYSSKPDQNNKIAIDHFKLIRLGLVYSYG